jgi:hypothetical protein
MLLSYAAYALRVRSHTHNDVICVAVMNTGNRDAVLTLVKL